jgi:hypothetical protein
MLIWQLCAWLAVQDGVEELRLLSMQPNRETYALLLKACAGEFVLQEGMAPGACTSIQAHVVQLCYFRPSRLCA